MDDDTTMMILIMIKLTMMMMMMIARPRLVRPLRSLNISESQLDDNIPARFHCEPLSVAGGHTITTTNTASGSSSSATDLSPTSVTWYINAQPLTRQ